MPRYALFLRAVNVGGNNRLKMADLRDLLANLGATEIETYIQSGNATLTHSAASAGELRIKVESALAEFMGKPISASVIPLASLTALVDENPFASTPFAGDPDARLCVTFICGEPPQPSPKQMEILPSGSLWFQWGEGHFLSVVSSVADNNPAGVCEKVLKCRATTRFWRTLEKMASS